MPPDPLALVTDYCGEGSLLSFILKNQGNISIEKKMRWIKDIATGMVRARLAALHLTNW